MDNLSALEVLRSVKGNFPTSLVKQHDAKGSLSFKQWHWVHKIAAENTKVAAAPVATLYLGKVFGLFTIASTKLKFPKVYLDTASGNPVKLTIAGEKSRYKGDIMITDGGSYGENQFYGRIKQDGSYHSHTQINHQDKVDGVIDLLVALNDDHVEVAKAFGKARGECCFCNKELSDNRSIEAGYGKTCAGNYGLPWGKKSTTTNDVVVATPKKAEKKPEGYWTIELDVTNGVWVIYYWTKYGSSSVLAGQNKKTYQDSYDMKVDAIAAYPDAEVYEHKIDSGNTYNHLPDTGDLY